MFNCFLYLVVILDILYGKGYFASAFDLPEHEEILKSNIMNSINVPFA